MYIRVLSAYAYIHSLKKVRNGFKFALFLWLSYLDYKYCLTLLNISMYIKCLVRSLEHSNHLLKENLEWEVQFAYYFLSSVHGNIERLGKLSDPVTLLKCLKIIQ